MMKQMAVPFLVAVGVTGLLASPAAAGLYYIAPVAPVSPGTAVILPVSDFIASVPEQSSGLSDPNRVIGTHLGQHPGAFDTGVPDKGTFFVGVFGAGHTADPGLSVFLWETTNFGRDSNGVTGPQIQLGFWDGVVFIAYGDPVAASYYGTYANGVAAGGRDITSSVTSLSEFHLSGTPFLNAVRITVVDESLHNQVTAVAFGSGPLVPAPEPSTFVLAAIAGGMWLVRAVRRRRRG